MAHGLPRLQGGLGYRNDRQPVQVALAKARLAGDGWTEARQRQTLCDAAAVRALCFPGPGWPHAREILRSFKRLFDATLECRKLTPDAD